MRVNNIVSGIYQIKNIITDDIYIGSSKDCGKRFGTHYRLLKLGIHTNLKLQNSWNKYGSKNFYFSTLELCDENILIEKEQEYIDKLNPELNIEKIVGSLNTPKAGSIEAKIRSQKNMEARKNSVWCNSKEFHTMMSEIWKLKWKDNDYRVNRSSETTKLWESTEYRSKQKDSHRKINSLERKYIKKLIEMGISYKELQIRFNVSNATISRINHGLN